MMSKMLVGFTVIITLLVFLGGCTPNDDSLIPEEDSALAGQTVSFPAGNINDVQYLDAAINTITSGLGYQCTKMTGSTSCSLVGGNIQRTYVSGGVTRTASHADGCRTVGTGQRSYDYGCLGNDVITCWKVCSGSCESGTGVCSGDVRPVCGNGVRDGSEICDGSDLVGQSCTSQGFTGGTLSCNADCKGFDTSTCTSTCIEGSYKVTDAGSCVGVCVEGRWATTACGPIPDLRCSSATDSSNILSKDNLFYLAGTIFQYKSADQLSKSDPRAKFRDLSTGQTLEYTTNKDGKARFNLKYGGKQYNFANHSDAYNRDDYTIFMVCD